ncbi:hypothetical protein JNK13_09650 [bacterium]|nr:hypothetical protein [bacterium]
MHRLLSLAMAAGQPGGSATQDLGAGNVCFDLSDLYQGIDDPQIMADLKTYVEGLRQFAAKYRGKLASDLAPALLELEELKKLSVKFMMFANLTYQLDVTDDARKALKETLSERVQSAWGEHMSWWEIEIAGLPEEVIETLGMDEKASRLVPYVMLIRKRGEHLLTAEEESLIATYGPLVQSWSAHYQAVMAGVTFTIEGPGFDEPMTGDVITALNIMGSDGNHDRRQTAMCCLNSALAEKLVPTALAALNAIAGEVAMVDGRRGYSGVFAHKHLDNNFSPASFDALSAAMQGAGREIVSRYYKLVAAHRGVDKLRWSDRLWVPYGSDTLVPWGDAVKLAEEAFAAIGPKMLAEMQALMVQPWSDAPNYKGKGSGAFCEGGCFPGGSVRAYMFYNHQGSPKDALTVPHELGHGVHFMLAGKAQGPLLMDAPLPLAETASTLVEVVALSLMLERCANDQERVHVLMSAISDFLSTAVRQMGFALFEEKFHTARRDGQVSLEQVTRFWQESLHELYGEDGEVFDFSDTDALWAYVHHFIDWPLYVYAYAAGICMSLGIWSKRDELGDRFEATLIQALEAGGSKTFEQIAELFGLDPTQPEFWNGAFEIMGAMLNQACELSGETWCPGPEGAHM